MTLIRGLLGVAIAIWFAFSAAALPSTSPHIAQVADHSIGLVGAPNFRDFGGYTTTDGRTVRRHLLFRSNALASLTPSDWSKVDSLGIRSVFALRTRAERLAAPDNWRRPLTVSYESPKLDLTGMAKDIRAVGGSPERLRIAMLRTYADMPFVYAKEYAAIFRALAHGETPILIHCTAGKDRTGVASALLLTALGVPRATVLDD